MYSALCNTARVPNTHAHLWQHARNQEQFRFHSRQLVFTNPTTWRGHTTRFKQRTRVHRDRYIYRRWGSRLVQWLPTRQDSWFFHGTVVMKESEALLGLVPMTGYLLNVRGQHVCSAPFFIEKLSTKNFRQCAFQQCLFSVILDCVRLHVTAARRWVRFQVTTLRFTTNLWLFIFKNKITI